MFLNASLFLHFCYDNICTLSMRHFSLPEIDLLAGQAGFARVRAEEFLTGTVPGEGTWGVCVVLQKAA
ncbi:MAG: hypothetical protein H7842_15245 [Gammaproteobacteria bacterium SHHR-1]